MSHNASECPTSADEIIPDDAKTLAIALILAGKCDTDVAKEVGVNRKTIYRWRNDDETFKNVLIRRRRELWQGVGDRLRSLLDPAVDVLVAQMHDRLDATRFKAATALLKLADVRKTVAAQEEP